MTWKAILAGLLAVAFITGYAYFNDHVMRQTMFVGNNMPISIYGFLVVFMIFLYPLLRRLCRGMAPSRAGIAVVLVLTLTACAIPGSNLLRLLTPSLLLPHYFEKVEPGWEKTKVMNLVPEGMLVDVRGREEKVLNGYFRGLSQNNKNIGFREVPWRAWVRPLAFWIPVILSLWIALIGLAVVVHRQWRDHEHLPYPIVTFTESLLPDAEGGQSPVFRNRIFWLGLLPVLVIHLYNFMTLWFPDFTFGKIPLGVDFSSLAKLSPAFEKGNGATFLGGYYTLFFTVIAVAYFLPKDVSLSLGIGPFLWIFVAGFLATYGIGTTGWQGGWPFGMQREGMMIMGAYFAILLVLLYTGRRYYSSVFKRAVGLRTHDTIENAAVWAARVFLAGMAFFTIYASIVAHLDWPIALLLGLGLVSVYLVMGRLLAETGLFFIVATGTPATIIWAFLGARALGPEILLVMFMFCLVLFYDTREALMPFVVNALKLADDCKLRVGRTAAWMVVAILVGLGVGIPTVLYFQYNKGIDLAAWQNKQPAVPFTETILAMQRLEAQGQLDTAGQVGGFKRFLLAAPNRNAVVTFGIAAGLVLIFSTLRLRFAKWPLHPVMFLVWSTYAGNCFAQSFLVGWFVKTLVTKYGGANIYQSLKPLMFGLIAGEMLGGVIPMFVSLIYYLVTGDQPKPFLVMPG